MQPQRQRATRYRALSIVFVPDGRNAPRARARRRLGAHAGRRTRIPAWLAAEPTGSRARSPCRRRATAAKSSWSSRAAVPAVHGAGRLGFVIVDIPIDDQMLDSALRARPASRPASIAARRRRRRGRAVGRPASATARRRAIGSRCSAAASRMLDASDWDDRARCAAPPSRSPTALRELYEQLSRAQSVQVGGDVARPGDPVHPRSSSPCCS